MAKANKISLRDVEGVQRLFGVDADGVKWFEFKSEDLKSVNLRACSVCNRLISHGWVSESGSMICSRHVNAQRPIPPDAA